MSVGIPINLHDCFESKLCEPIYLWHDYGGLCLLDLYQSLIKSRYQTYVLFISFQRHSKCVDIMSIGFIPSRPLVSVYLYLCLIPMCHYMYIFITKYLFEYMHYIARLYNSICTPLQFNMFSHPVH